MADVGRMAGVSQVTVSRALSDPAKVNPDTLERIRAAIRATGFVPNAVAGALASSRSRLVSALVPSITNVVYSSLIRAFSERIRQKGYQMLLSETGYDPAEEEATVLAHLSRRPDAMLLTGIDHSPETRRMLLVSGTPVVEVWDVSDSPIDLCVGFDHAAAARAAADFAVSRGYTRAVTVTASDRRAGRRRDVFAARMREITGREVRAIDIDGPSSLPAGRGALDRIDLAEGRVFLFCSSDLLAHGALIEAAARGLPVPEQVAIMGFGDQDFARAVVPPLTTLRVDRGDLGHRAAEALLARIDGILDAPPVTRLPFEVIPRETT